jgi:hypothetical protein
VSVCELGELDTTGKSGLLNAIFLDVNYLFQVTDIAGIRIVTWVKKKEEKRKKKRKTRRADGLAPKKDISHK